MKTGKRAGRLAFIPASKSLDRKSRYSPTVEDREAVAIMSSCGIPQQTIARLLKISIHTLRAHFADPLETALYQKNSEVASALFEAARGGNITAMIFWLKTRAGWKEGQPPPLPEEKTKFDYSRLTLQEMLEMKRLMEKAAVEPLVIDVHQRSGSTADA